MTAGKIGFRFNETDYVIPVRNLSGVVARLQTCHRCQDGGSSPGNNPLRQAESGSMRRMALGLALLLFAGADPAQAASAPATEGQHGMVVTSQRLASEAGVEILRQGGNASNT